MSLSGFSFFESIAIFSVLGIAFIGLGYALILRKQVLSADTGDEKMKAIWQGIHKGAETYLDKQWKSIRLLIAVLFFALFASAWIVTPSPEAISQFGSMARLAVALGRAGAFLMGASFSSLVGRWGMRMAIQGNLRVAAAAKNNSYTDALRIAYRSGTITGMLTDGLGLLGGTLIFIIFGKAAPDALLGFGFGGTLLALFMRVGGGIFTKAADVGADLVGKVEHDIPEDDPRNPAVIADLVGDNVGDCAGMAADIFESYEVTIVSALILGLSLWHITGDLKWIVFPLLVRGIGVLSSVFGTYFVKGTGNNQNPMAAINKGFYTSAAISIFGFGLLAMGYMHEWRAFASTLAGVVLAIIIDKVTEYFTDYEKAPVASIARSTKTGAATTILSGLAVGLESSVWSVLVIAITIMVAVGIYWGQPVAFVLYGVAMTGIGMLTLTGNNVAMDSFGPIVDNAGGIGEMAKFPEKAQQILAKLDATGNTTKAITKGVAIGSAVIAAVSLFGAFITDVQKINPLALNSGIRISEPIVFVGLLIGGAIPFLFSSLLIKSVSRTASSIVNEVRRQFKEMHLLTSKDAKPDYSKPIALCTTAAQKELLPIGAIAVLAPILVGLLLREEALGAFLAGVILSGQLLAVFMANAGGAWDNAKKFIEIGNYGGKGSEAHKASVVGDTVGDPLKDTAGPALNPMIKVMNLISVIIAPMIVSMKMNWEVYLIAAVLFFIIVWAILQGKKEVTDITMNEGSSKVHLV
jgi:K(+)-stimulated pyrophosphate-energized sodium pump